MISQAGRPYRHGGASAVTGGGLAAAELVRCACQGCGSHVHALVLLQTISGLCTTCGGCDIAALET